MRLLPAAVAAASVFAITMGNALGNPVVPDGRTDNFRHGSYPSLGDRTHAGVDLVAPCGSPVFALRDGQVIDVVASEDDRNFNSLGYMALIRHQDMDGRPLATLYLHLQDPPRVRVDDPVRAGTEIGRVGETGFSPIGCHVHFEARRFLSRFHPVWRNIYGNGDQRETLLFRRDWADPEQLFSGDGIMTVSQLRIEMSADPVRFEADHADRSLSVRGRVDSAGLIQSAAVQDALGWTDGAWFVGLAASDTPAEEAADEVAVLCVIAVDEYERYAHHVAEDQLVVSGPLIGVAQGVPILQPCRVLETP